MIEKGTFCVIRVVILLTLAYLSGPGMNPIADASPLGTTYQTALDLPVLTASEIDGNFRNDIPFDENPDELPNDIGTGNDLWIIESFSRDTSSGQEKITILIFGSDGENPTQLTGNQIDPSREAFLEVTGLYWANATAGVEVVDYSLARSFDGGSVFEVISPDDIFEEFGGAGTETDPLNLFFEFPADPLTRFKEPAGFENATDLILGLTVQPVPIPGSIIMLISGLLGLLAVKRSVGTRSWR